MTVTPLSVLLRSYLGKRMLLPGLVFVLGIAAFLGAQRWLDIQREQHLQTVIISEYVHSYLAFTKEIVNVLVQVAPSSDFSSIVAQYREYSDAFERILLINDQGEVLETFPALGTLLDYAQLIPEQHGEQRDAIRVSSPYIAPLSSNLTVSLFSDSVKQRMVVGELNLLSLQNFIAGLGQMTRGGMVYVTDRHGNVVAHPDRTIVDQQTNMGEIVPVAMALQGATGFLGVHAVEGSYQLFSTAHVPAGDWLVFTVWNARLQVFSILAVMAVLAVLLFFLMVVTVWLLKRKLDREVSRPLAAFTLAMDGVEKGDPESFKQISQQIRQPFRELGLLRQRFKEMVEAIAQREQYLRQSEERFRNLAESLPESVFEMDMHCVLKYVNSNTLARFGYNRAEVKFGLKLMDLVHSEERKKVFAHAEGVLRDEQVVPLEFTGVCKDGSTFPARLHSSAIFEHGRPRGVRGFIIDLTQSKLEQGQLLEMERQLLHTQKLESLGVLAGGIAHDFNNLLAAIQGNLELALMSIEDRRSPEYLRIVQANAAVHRATELTRQMLAYSGKGRFMIQNVNLNDFIRENIAMLQAVISKTITLDMHMSPDIPMINADPGQLQQVVLNLITNASEAMEELPGTMTLRTGVMDCDMEHLSQSRVLEKPKPGSFVYFEVSDTGCGMDPLTMERLFEPFYTTKFTGRGLGLAAVLGIIQGHGGAVFVDSGHGKGSHFRVLFPVSERTAAADRAEPPQLLHENENARQNAGNGLVLVVDDELMVRELCVEALHYLDYQTLEAGDGEEAVRVFQERSEEVFCVILDLTMPKMNGVAALNAMRKINPGIKVILCSGYNEQEATRNFLDESPTSFLKKPFSLSELKTELDRIVPDAEAE